MSKVPLAGLAACEDAMHVLRNLLFYAAAGRCRILSFRLICCFLLGNTRDGCCTRGVGDVVCNRRGNLLRNIHNINSSWFLPFLTTRTLRRIWPALLVERPTAYLFFRFLVHHDIISTPPENSSPLFVSDRPCFWGLI